VRSQFRCGGLHGGKQGHKRRKEEQGTNRFHKITIASSWFL
jgi:hypothetical protein